MCACLKTSRPERFCGSFGRNQEPHIGTVLGDVDSFVVAFDLRAVASSEGDTRYERNVLWARTVAILKLNLRLKVVAGRGWRSSTVVAILTASDVTSNDVLVFVDPQSSMLVFLGALELCDITLSSRCNVRSIYVSKRGSYKETWYSILASCAT